MLLYVVVLVFSRPLLLVAMIREKYRKIKIQREREREPIAQYSELYCICHVMSELLQRQVDTQKSPTQKLQALAFALLR